VSPTRRHGRAGGWHSGIARASARARQRWQGLLAEYKDPDLDKSIARQLQDYVENHLN
jgi:trimethylamine:corrinoid methyltransferase-like protein